MNLAKILNSVKVVHVSGNAEEREIDSIEIDSRKVKPNSVFVAIKGFNTDGHDFIQQAISAGASAVVVEDDSKAPAEMFIVNDVVKIAVENSRMALSQLSAALYDFPARKLNLIGVTGTKGKTTTSFYIKNIIETAGNKCGLIGTNKYIVGNREYAAERTTPEANVIHKLLKDMTKAGCNFSVMEVSSHSLELMRVSDLDFSAAVFTNITSDHLDYHKTFEAYREAKAKLFEQLSHNAIAILNANDKNADYFLQRTEAGKVTFGETDKSDYKMENIEYSLEGTKWRVVHGSVQYELETDLIGKFNAYNATAAFCAAVECGVEPDAAVKGIALMPQVPGRFEVFKKGNKKVIIDYAHTADSLEQALVSVRHLLSEEQSVVTVFGCGGDRDKFKRPVMGAIAAKYSDKVIVTSDNPRGEDPYAIIEDIKKGMKSDNYSVVVNREEAIREAILNSPSNAVVLIAGKGHETYQEVKGVKRHFSDKETAEKYLSEID